MCGCQARVQPTGPRLQQSGTVSHCILAGGLVLKGVLFGERLLMAVMMEPAKRTDYYYYVFGGESKWFRGSTFGLGARWWTPLPR